MPTISVIIPAYNAQKTIQETINSVLNQTFSDFELIVINDGSQDSTLEIVSSISDLRMRVYSYPNAGPQKSRNRGIAQATGEYVSFLDADDLWRADKLEAQLQALQGNSQAAVAYSWTDYINESGQYLRPGPQFEFNGDVYARLLLSDFVGSGSNPLIRTSALQKVGNFDESLPAAQDWEMWLRLAAQYHFVAVPSVQVLYRVSANSWSANVERMEVASLRVIEEAFARAPESIQHLKQTCIANRYKGLTWKSLAGFPERRKGLIAAKFFWYALINDPSLLRKRIIWKVVLKIPLFVLLPTSIAQALLAKMKRLANLEALLVQIKTEPF
ncbi:MAG: glycosyltransferase [Symploca sp. SIO1B1]|nr:glycosyltransferase [Symploca sp. SIO1B1]